ncbi:MAG: fasciclin domain-containing protein, partial [Armatimonadetes bacterium]|nr:fasciclin domain-containing protein [Armatimonadota bacterium]
MADIVEIAVQAGNFKTLVAALQAADLVDALKQPGPFTVFAPTDDAFAKLPAGTIDDLLKPENKDKLVKVL